MFSISSFAYLVATILLVSTATLAPPNLQQSIEPDERICYPVEVDTQAGTYTLPDNDGERFTVARTNTQDNARLVLINDCHIIASFSESYGAASITIENGYPVITSVSVGKRQGLRYIINERFGYNQVRPQWAVAALPFVAK